MIGTLITATIAWKQRVFKNPLMCHRHSRDWLNQLLLNKNNPKLTNNNYLKRASSFNRQPRIHKSSPRKFLNLHLMIKLICINIIWSLNLLPSINSYLFSPVISKKYACQCQFEKGIRHLEKSWLGD